MQLPQPPYNEKDKQQLHKICKKLFNNAALAGKQNSSFYQFVRVVLNHPEKVLTSVGLKKLFLGLESSLQDELHTKLSSKTFEGETPLKIILSLKGKLSYVQAAERGKAIAGNISDLLKCTTDYALKTDNYEIKSIVEKFKKATEQLRYELSSEQARLPTRIVYREQKALCSTFINSFLLFRLQDMKVSTRSDDSESDLNEYIDAITNISRTFAQNFQRQKPAGGIALKYKHKNSVLQIIDAYKLSKEKNNPTFHHKALSATTYDTALELERLIHKNTTPSGERICAITLQQKCSAMMDINRLIIARETQRQRIRDTSISSEFFIPAKAVGRAGANTVEQSVSLTLGLPFFAISAALFVVTAPVAGIGALIEHLTKPQKGSLLSNLNPVLEEIHHDVLLQMNEQYEFTMSVSADKILGENSELHEDTIRHALQKTAKSSPSTMQPL